MKYLDPSEQVLIPVTISIRPDTAGLLIEMANDMNISLDELISALAEDSVVGLSTYQSLIDDVLIPDRCSKNDLKEAMNRC